jgi:stage V sporulation protein B
LKRSIYASYIVQVIAVAVNFIYTLVIVHQLGAKGYGDYSLFFNSLAFAILVLGFNLPSIIIFFTANKKVDEGKLLHSCIFFNLISSALLGLVLAWSDRIGFSHQVFPGGENKGILIFFFVAQFFLIQTSQVLTAFLNAHKIFIPAAVLSLFGNLCLLTFWVLFNAGLIQIGSDVFNLVWWVAITINLLVTAGLILLLRKNQVLPAYNGLISKADVGLLKSFILIVYLCNSIQFLNYKMDLYIINYFSLREDVGVYALALSLSQLIWVLPNAISGVLINYFRVNEKENSVELAVNYARLAFYGSLVCAAILLLVYYFALPLLYGPSFHETFRLCAILFIGTIPLSLSIIIANLNSGIGLVKLNLYATVFVFILGLVLDIIFIKLYGLTGAAMVKSFVYIAGLAFQIAYAKRFYKLSLWSLLRIPDLKLITSLKN